MKKKIFTLLMLLLCAVTGMQAASYTKTWDFSEFSSTIENPSAYKYRGLTIYGQSNKEKITSSGFTVNGTTQTSSSIWGRYIEFIPIANGTLTVTAVGNGNSAGRYAFLTTVLQKPSSAPTAGGTIIAVSTDLASGTAPVTGSFSDVAVTAGTTYYIEAYSGITFKSIAYTYNSTGADIITQPVSAEYAKDETPTALSVVAEATAGTLSYQWYSNTTGVAAPATDSPISGATAATLPAANISTAAAGTTYYYVVVTDGNGATTSSLAAISVVAPVAPSLTIAGSNNIARQSSSNVTLTATITAGVPAPTVQWYICDSDGSNEAEIDGATSLTYTPATTSTGTFYYLAKATNTQGTASSNVVSLRVAAAGSSGAVGDLVAVSTGYTFIADDITLGGNSPATANTLYDGGRVFTTKANTAKTDKGTTDFDGIAYKNSLRLRNGEDIVFKTSGACILTIYCSDVNGNDLGVGSTSAGTDYGTWTASLRVGTRTCIIPSAGVVYITGNSNSSDFCIAGFSLTALPTFKLNASGYSTFSYNQPVEIVSGAKAYTAALDFANSTITCTEITSNKIPAGNGVLMYGEANADIVVKTAFGDVDALVGNNLHGTTAADGSLVAKGSNSYYVLSGDTFKNYTGAAFAANKAYFEVDGDDNVQAREWSIVFEGDETTGINTVLGSEFTVNGEYYDLQGRRVAQPTKGLYIVNGRKVVIK